MEQLLPGYASSPTLFLFYMVPVKVEYKGWGQIFTNVVQEPTIFPEPLAMGRIQKFHLKTGVSLSLKRRSMRGISVEYMFITIVENSGFAQR